MPDWISEDYQRREQVDLAPVDLQVVRVVQETMWKATVPFPEATARDVVCDLISAGFGFTEPRAP